jgi:hypothetical protein
VNAVGVRSQLVEALELDLVGPSNGHAFAHELLPDRPHQWYLTGFLVPSKAPLEQRQDDTADEEVATEVKPTGADDDTAKDAAPRKSVLPSSMGLSVLTAPGVESIEAIVEWGDYADERPGEVIDFKGAPAAAATHDDGKFKPRGYRRTPREARVTVPLPAANTSPVPILLPESGGMVLVVTVRNVREGEGPSSLKDGTKSVSVFVVNQRPPLHKSVHEAYAFQVKLTLRSERSFVPRPDLRTGESQDDARDDWDDRVADIQYRDVFEYAVGHGVAATWDDAAPGDCRAVSSTWVPRAEVERVEPAKIDLVELHMEELGALKDSADAAAKLMPLVKQYGEWLEVQGAKAKSLDKHRRATFEDMAKEAVQVKNRIEAGIKQLEDTVVLEAFRIANRCMARAARQRTWVTQNRTGSPAALQPPKWRPFQLAFILMTMAGIAEPTHDDRKIVDLLFFPTGGGKTEAYLGLAAFTMVLRRFRNEGGMGCGLTVLMRYTLRLLTLDQLGRAAGLVCALELEREKNPALGTWPFEIGLWVGQAATPNRMGHRGYDGPGKENTAYAKTMHFKKDDSRYPSPIPIENCPWCGERFTRNSFWLKPSEAKPLDLRVCCMNRHCEFSGDRHLPVLGVDEPIYRRLPAFMIATVDKFASLPWTGETGCLFGRVTHHDKEGFYGPCGPKQGTALKAPLPPPDLIIQDELHLISGPLGTIAGVYEAAVERLCTRKVGEKEIRPKIIASTATVRLASQQIRALFDRTNVTIFPPPGPDRRDSFFAITVDPTVTPARLYIGLAAQGRSLKVLLLRAALAVLSAAKVAYIRDGGERNAENVADAYMTLLGYFNSLRELGGSRRIIEDEVRTRLQQYDRRKRLEPADELFTKREIQYEPIELTSRVSTDQVAEAKRRLALGFQDEHRVDTALATNMISVGLDITRLGLMMVLGQPKTTAEYIQATSRVGRQSDRPGLVVTLLNIHKPRDRSHYERFEGYHASFYRAVEATSVTPYSPRALDRALPAALVAMCRHEFDKMTPAYGAHEVLKHRDQLTKLAAYFAERARNHAWPPGDDSGQRLYDGVFHRCTELLDDWVKIAKAIQESNGTLQYQREAKTAPRLLWEFLNPDLPDKDQLALRFRANRSMRDVEPSVELHMKRLSDWGSRP